MLTIAPPPCSRMTGIAALVVSHVPLRFTSRILSKATSSACWAGPSRPPCVPPMPTLLTRMSIRPSRAFAVSMIACASAACTMSASNAEASPPAPCDHRRRLLGAGEHRGRRTALARPRARTGSPWRGRCRWSARRLAGADDDGGLVLQPHRPWQSGPQIGVERRPRARAGRRSCSGTSRPGCTGRP